MMIATTKTRFNFIIELLIINIHNKIQTYLGVFCVRLFLAQKQFGTKVFHIYLVNVSVVQVST